MPDEFITKGLEDSRYLKAVRLVDEFEERIEAIVQNTGQRLIEQQPALFDSDSPKRVKTNRSPGNGLATHRVNYHMRDELFPDESKTPRLNVHLYWFSPSEYNRIDINETLRAFGYKVKHGDEDIDEMISDQTKSGDWQLQTSSNPYDSNTVFYRHVDSALEIEETAEVLVKHFNEFGDRWAEAKADV